MKKLALLLVGVALFVGCATKEDSQTAAVAKSAPVIEKPETAQPAIPAEQPAAKAAAPVKSSDCKINNHACWDVVKKLGSTKEIRTENPDKDSIWAPDIITYENPDLAAWGIKVTFYTMYRDGGSTDYILDDKVSIHTNRSLGMTHTPAYGMVTIKFKESGEKFIYDAQGEFQGDGAVFPD